MIYFDNCSTTHNKPKCVLRAIKQGLTRYNYNPGRGGYNNAIQSNLKVLELRDSATLLFGAENSNNVIITKSCTEAINIALRSSIKNNGHIIATVYEHNSVLRTLHYLKENYNIDYTLITPNKEGIIEVADIEKNIRPNTYLIATNHISNVTGHVQNIREIGQLCKDRNLIYFVDGAQSAGHTDINMREMHINYLSIAGHKGTLGPQGIGLLLCRNITPKPLIFGGTGTYSESIIQPSDVPEGLESGTLSMANIMGLNAGIKYVSKNLRKIETKLQRLTRYLIKELLKLKNITVYSNSHSHGVVAFNVDGMTSNEVSAILDQEGFEIRSGLHCAPMIHQYHNTTNIGMCRIGLSHTNNIRQVKKLIKILKKM